MFKRFVSMAVLLLIVAVPSFAQVVHTVPALDTDNVYTGVNQFTLGLDPGPLTFSALGSQPNGWVVYCSNCQQTNPCLGSGTGAVATKIAGAWSCAAGTTSNPGGSGITGTLTQNKLPKAASSGVNPTVSDTSITDTGSNVTIPVFENTAHSADYIWSASPAGSLTATVQATVTLTPCPKGVDTSNNADSPYIIRVAATGTPEQVQVTGGTCTSGATTGTVIFTPAGSHGAGFTLGTATSGIKEALNAFPGPNSHLIVPPILGGNAAAYPIYTKVIVNNSRTTIDAAGALVQCFTRDSCVFIGNLTNASGGAGVTLNGLRFLAGTNVDGVRITNASVTSNVMTVTVASHPFVAGDKLAVVLAVPGQTTLRNLVTVTSVTGTTIVFPVTARPDFSILSAFGTIALQNAMIEDNGEGTNLTNIKVNSFGNPAKFSNYVVFDDDQAALMHHFIVDGSTLLVTANWTGWVVWINGTAVVTIDGQSDLSASCGNGIHALGGNGLSIKDTIIQAYSQHAIWQGRSGLQGITLSNVYFEVASCPNLAIPGGTLISANGILQHSQLVKSDNGYHAFGPLGQMPPFSQTGSNNRYYYIVVQAATPGGPSIPLYAGYASSDNTTPITVYWNQIVGSSVSGAISYDVLVTTGTPTPPAPNGTGNYSIATANSGSCSAGICSFTDNFTAPSSYTVLPPRWFPLLWEWPGGIVTSSIADIANTLNPAMPTYVSDYVNSDTFSPLITTSGVQTVFGSQCSDASPAISWTVCPAYVSSFNAALPIQYGVPWPGTAGVTVTGLKGRYIFEGATSTPNHFITLFDSNPAKTFATLGHRPVSDANDMYIGTDDTVGNVRDLALGAARNTSFYSGNVGDGTSWSARINANGIQPRNYTFATLPAAVNGTQVYCTDCNSTCTAGSSTGRTCFRENSAWTH